MAIFKLLNTSCSVLFFALFMSRYIHLNINRTWCAVAEQNKDFLYRLSKLATSFFLTPSYHTFFKIVFPILIFLFFLPFPVSYMALCDFHKFNFSSDSKKISLWFTVRDHTFFWLRIKQGVERKLLFYFKSSSYTKTEWRDREMSVTLLALSSSFNDIWKPISWGCQEN